MTGDHSPQRASVLTQLQAMSVIVADTGELDAIATFRPMDATTNPSLLLKVAQNPKYAYLLEDAISQHLNQQKVSRDNHRLNDDDVDTVCDRFAVLVGRKIIELITGRVSTEVPARFSFDTDATVAKARTLIDLYNAEGIATDRVLIKVAGTWEGIRAAEILEKSGIQCNVTLIFNAAQAAASAEAGAYLISPFVGRILDWHTAHRGFSDPNPAHDPGVISVRTIYHYFKTKGLNTIVMGASFRNTGEIIALAGCDRLTISPALLSELASDHETIITRQLSPTGETQAVTGIDVTNIDTDEPDFRWQLNHDEMAHFKLAEGIRKFHSDYEALRAAIKAR